MGRNEDFITGKAALVFPELIPQAELDLAGLRSKARPIQIASKWISARRPEPTIRPEPVREIEPTTDLSSKIQATVLSVRNLHEHGDLYLRYMRARRDVFIVQKGWNLPEIDGMEFDQYDTPLARWIALQIDDQVVAGARIAPTTAQCGSHSYMLRDAQLGLLLPSLPTDLLYETAPVQESIWEATRLFVTNAVPSEQRLQVQSRLMREMMDAISSVGATHAIGIVPAVFKRWLKRIGMTAVEMGPIKGIDGDKVQAALFDASVHKA